MVAALRSNLFTLSLLLILVIPGISQAQKSVFENGLLLVPRVDIDGYGPLELAFSLVPDGGVTLKLEQFREASLLTPRSGEFYPELSTLRLYGLELVGTNEVYLLELQVVSLSPDILFEVTYAELLPPDSGQPAASASLTGDQQLNKGEWLDSENGLFRLRLNDDGNLVLLDIATNTTIWNTGTQSAEDTFLVLQGGDGNLVLYTESFQPLWNSGTQGLGVDRLTVNNDGSLGLYAGSNRIWAVNLSGSVGNTLQLNEQIGSAQWLESANGQFRLELSDEGNLVLRNVQADFIAWDTGTQGSTSPTLIFQGDGNLVNIGTTGDLIWASGTHGIGADRFTLNNDGSLALYAGYEVLWAVNGSGQQADDVLKGQSGGDNGGGMKGDELFSELLGTGRFSAPSAALYALNDSRQRAFPQQLSTPFSGNGHAETWDGRVFVVSREDGWHAMVFRPERIGFSSEGQLNFYTGAFGTSIPLELNDDAEDIMHNWVAITPDPQAGAENPYPSDSDGNYLSTGSYRTYKAIVYHTSKRGGDDTHVGNEQMGLRHATFIVSDANTPGAQLVSGEFTSQFTRLHLQNDDSDFLCIEPSVTMDSRLLFCQGHPANDGTIDNLVYSWTATPGSAFGWTAPRSVANMYYEDRDVDVEGLPFFVRYAIAENPLSDADGNAYANNALVKGAYPWISHDGSELFYQASAESESGRRTGTSVVGRWTGWSIRHIDGPINRDRYDTLRLFLSSPGAFTTMWAPYKDVRNLAMPFSIRGPGYPLFGSNTYDYMEVSFDDFLDGNYVLYLGMNEHLDRAGNYQVTRTDDTSGNFNNGTLNGALFPFEYNGEDILVGRHGQGIFFPAGSYIDVERNSGWETLQHGFTVELFVKILTPADAGATLFSLENGVDLVLEEGGSVRATISDSGSNSATISGSALVSNEWVHVAVSYDPSTEKLALFIDGLENAQQVAADFATLNTTGKVQIGSGDSTGLMIVDEVKVSNVARRPYEIGYSANTRYNRPPSQELLDTVPEHFQSLLSKATSVDRFSLAAAELGAQLFSDPILSREQTTSCATCHVSSLSFTDGRSIAQGNEPTDAGTRNSPMLLNRLFSSLQGWSGISESLDTQALFPIAATHEMNLPIPEAVQRLQADQDYVDRFQDVYGEPIDATNMTAALASFQAMQFTPRTRADDFMDGNPSALNASERRGLALFEGKARCSGCHSGRNFTDESFRSNGLTFNADIGRAEVTGRSRDYRLFKTPSLRQVSKTAPYMHDGSIATLREVIERYNAGAVGVESIDTDIRPLELNSQEIDDLTAFLEAL